MQDDLTSDALRGLADKLAQAEAQETINRAGQLAFPEPRVPYSTRLKAKYGMLAAFSLLTGACVLFGPQPDGWTIMSLVGAVWAGKVTESIAMQRGETK